MEKHEITIILFIMISGFLLFLFRQTRYYRMTPRLRALFLLPLAAVLNEVGRNGLTWPLAGVYLCSLLLVLPALTDRPLRPLRPVCLAAAGSALLLCPWANSRRSPGFADDFAECFRQMRSDYVLTAHKGIDWDALYDTYYPIFREADAAGDPALCYAAGRAFAWSFHDGHVSFSYGADEAERTALAADYDRAHCGDDQGFSLLRLTDGRVVFVLVDPESAVYAAGVRDGLELLTLNGEDINAVTERADLWFDSFPDIENARFYAPLAVSVTLTGAVELTFTGTDGVTHTAKTEPGGSAYPRFQETLRLLNAERETGNLHSYMADADTGCLVLNGMMESSTVIASDAAQEWARSAGIDPDAARQKPYGSLKMQVGYEISELRRQGAESLIIDLRNNGGGRIDMTTAVAALLTDEALFVANEGEQRPDGSQGVYCTLRVEPQNCWGSGRIAVLVNSRSASAAEIFARCIGQMENVTVMGLTKTCGCAQATVAVGSGRMAVSESHMLMLDEQGGILIDGGTDRLNRYTPDLRIPLDEAAVQSIFTDRTDYVLAYANEFLDGRQ